MYERERMLSKRAATSFLMTPDHFDPTNTLDDSQLLSATHQRETKSVGKSYIRSIQLSSI